MNAGPPETRPSRSALCPVVVGPTAVGKTGLILEVARGLPIEVISLDSRQIYRGMRIGTAQPTAGERRICPHHLVDFVSPREKYSAARFRRDFRDVFREIRARDRIPILVGGAGLYLKVLQQGLIEFPGGSEQDLARVREELAALSATDVRQLLLECDPESWRRIHANDRYRAQRALEIHRLTGQSMSRWMEAQRRRPVLGLEFPVLLLARPVRELDARIAARTESMLAGGWIDETELLLRTHGPEAHGLRTLGYREVAAFLQGRLGRERLSERINTAIRQYAKRQRTWFRAVRHHRAGQPEDPALRRELESLIRRAGPGPGEGCLEDDRTGDGRA
jgi:tRNA dimethylallyltransferase